MASIDKKIREGEEIIENGGAKFEASVSSLELLIADEIRKILKVVDVKGGKITSNQKAIDFLASMQSRIRNAMNQAGYEDKVKELLKNFAKIKANNIAIHEIANNVIIQNSTLTGIQKLEVQNALDKLVGTGIDAEFINPMREALYRNITFGGSIADAEQIIESYVVSTPQKQSVLRRYAGQISRDAISQFDGAIQQTIADELGLDGFLYAGTIISDTRAQCAHWVKKRILKKEELEADINKALTNGYFGGKRASGMIPGTNVDNFSVYRGGYNCRHRAIAVKT
jgi:hypothetical protein